MTQILSLYDVPPFGREYAKNIRIYKNGANDTTPCALCGRPIKGEAKHGGLVAGGGSSWTTDAIAASGPAGMGFQPVGSDCHRKHVVR